MKILVADPISFIGHVNYNYGIYRALARDHDCKLITNEAMKSAMMKKGVPRETFLAAYSDGYSLEALAKKHRNKAVYHLLYRKHLLDVYRMIDACAREFDAVVLTSVDVYSFALFSGRIQAGRYIVMDHAIGTLQVSRLYREAWKRVGKKVKLIVFEDYIREMALRWLPDCKVFRVPHPLAVQESALREAPPRDGVIRVFAPSASNDAAFVAELEKSDIPPNMAFRVKIGRENDVVKPGLTEYHARVSEQEYLDAFAAADYIMIPYGPEYNYRYSGVLLEAVQMNKKVLLLGNNTLAVYKDVFPGHVFLFGSAAELMQTAAAHVDTPCGPCDLTGYKDPAIADALAACLAG